MVCGDDPGVSIWADDNPKGFHGRSLQRTKGNDLEAGEPMLALAQNIKF
jgi:hypothetical protein